LESLPVSGLYRRNGGNVCSYDCYTQLSRGTRRTKICNAKQRGGTSCPSILDHKIVNLQDQPVSLCQFGGKVLLIVNTASECGYTPQYEGLEKLYRRYREKGFVILGFPANDFGGQEPGSNVEIAQFCRLNYGVTFPMFARRQSSAQTQALYRSLAAQTGKPPRWNFHKYLLDRSGQPVGVFESAVEPADARITSQIEKLLVAR
jgi:glutathione peroxidase